LADGRIGTYLLQREWKRKMRSNQGAPYVSDTTGRNIPGCEVGHPCKYKRSKCQLVLQGRELGICDNFRSLGDFNIRNAYLFSCNKAARSKRAYPKNRSKSDSSTSSSTFSFHVKVEGSGIKIC
jgi:hypothetical protein